MLPIFKIGQELNESEIPGVFVAKEPCADVEGAETYTYKIEEGTILLTIFDGLLHEVIYQTPKKWPWSRRKKNKYLFSSYCSKSGWEERLDNGFGKIYRSNDGEMYALWSYAMDFNTFGTMAFHEISC